MGDAVVALIRTVIPALIGSCIAWLVAQGLDIDESTTEALTVAAVSVSIGLYYLLVTTLERKVHPAFGWLLGYAAPPAYPTREATTTQAPDNEGA